MDTISRESSPSYLPIAGLIAGLVGLLLGGIALANASKANKAAVAADAKVTEQIARIDGAESAANNANSTAERAAGNIASLQRSTQDAFTAVAGEMGKINGELAKLQEAAKAAPAKTSATKTPSGPVTAGPDEYVVKSGDTGMKIAAANGVSISDLQAVNPSVNWKALKVGQKVKLPAKK
jgi:LysM repeat protein